MMSDQQAIFHLQCVAWLNVQCGIVGVLADEFDDAEDVEGKTVS